MSTTILSSLGVEQASCFVHVRCGRTTVGVSRTTTKQGILAVFHPTGNGGLLNSFRKQHNGGHKMLQRWVALKRSHSTAFLILNAGVGAGDISLREGSERILKISLAGPWSVVRTFTTAWAFSRQVRRHQRSILDCDDSRVRCLELNPLRHHRQTRLSSPRPKGADGQGAQLSLAQNRSFAR